MKINMKEIIKFDYCDVTKISDIDLKNAYNLMDFEKKERVKRYYRNIDKKCTIAGDLLVRKMISEYYNIEKEKIKIGINKNGKPYVINNNIEFNISHSENIVVCVISKNKVGIDIEKIKPINLSMVNTFCNKEEINYIFKHIPVEDELVYSDKKDLLIRFFKIWTSKEAVIKAYANNISNIKSTFSRNVYSFKFLDKYIVSMFIIK